MKDNPKFYEHEILKFSHYNVCIIQYKTTEGYIIQRVNFSARWSSKIEKMWTKLTYSFLNSKLKISTNKMLTLFMSYGIFKLFIKYYKS